MKILSFARTAFFCYLVQLVCCIIAVPSRIPDEVLILIVEVISEDFSHQHDHCHAEDIGRIFDFSNESQVFCTACAFLLTGADHGGLW